MITVFGPEYLRAPTEEDTQKLMTESEASGWPGQNYSMGSYLADGIYPSWATLVKKIKCPKGNKNTHVAQCQEATRKGVERAFGVLQKRFAIVLRPRRVLELQGSMVNHDLLHHIA